MKTKKSKTSTSEKTNSSATHTERVSQRAYEIWEACGCPHGCDQEHWRQAEDEVKRLTENVPE